MTSKQKSIQQIFKILLSTGKLRKLSPKEKVAFIIIGVSMSLFQIWTVTIAKLDPMIEMSIHLSFIFTLTFFLYNLSENIKRNHLLKTIDYLLIALSASSGLYYFFHAERLSTRIVSVDSLTTLDMFFGIIFV